MIPLKVPLVKGIDRIEMGWKLLMRDCAFGLLLKLAIGCWQNPAIGAFGVPALSLIFEYLVNDLSLLYSLAVTPIR